MDGKTHAVVGGIVGGLVSVGVGNDVASFDTGVLVTVGTVAGLVPDLDTNGKLSNKMTLSNGLMKMLGIILGVLMMMYSITSLHGIEMLVGVGISLVVVVLSRYITQRRMLTMTGAAILVLGMFTSVLWIILTGVYVVVASFLGHRTYTHSIIGLVYFGYIAHLVSLEYSGVEGLFLTMVMGYVSHLVLDFKVFNRRGVKLFRPFINKEF